MRTGFNHKVARGEPPLAGTASRARGAVLLEVILALVLFVAAATIVTSGMNAALESVERQRRNAHAMNLAVTVMSELQMGLRTAASSGPEDFPAPFEAWTWEVQVAPMDAEVGESSSLSKAEVMIRNKTNPVVQRLAQVIRLGTVKSERKEVNAGSSSQR
jgi:hypothetical protein